LKIQRLELIGFKSFKDRTVITFDDGITGIVGPNGCGKSNIVDALVWVMGEQSAKHLRGASMEDVIFNGSENFSPLGMAEVSLTLANDGGPFPAKWAKHSEIMITRRLHRSGESEYFINKEICRLKDIVDIFMDTGAGSKGFSIVEQGQIGKIITAKPEDRRTLIEEAAGITKFKVRKRESQRKLESTEQNLVRLNDIIGELRRQLDSLQRQAKRAERYKEIKTRTQELDLWISSKKYLEIKSELDALARGLEEKKLLSEEGQTQYSSAIAELQNLKLDLLELERNVTQEQTRHFEIQTQVQKKESSLQLLQLEIDTTKRNEELAGTLKSEVSARRDILQRDLDHSQAQLRTVEGELEKFNREAIEKGEISALAVLKSREFDEKLTQVRRELMSTIQSLTTVEVKISAYQTSQEELARRLSDSEAVATELNSKKEEFETVRNKAFASLESYRQMQLNIMNDVKNFEENQAFLKAEVAERRAQVEEFKDEHNKVVGRLHGLEALTANFEGLHDGVKKVMTWQKEKHVRLTVDGGVEETFQLVADVVEVPKDYEMAMEAALGDRLQSILTPRSESAINAVGLLKEERAGRSTFFNADLMDDARRQSFHVPEDDPRVKGYLKDLIKVPEQHQKTLAHILDGVVVVDTLQTALQLRPALKGYSFVTLDGDVLSQDGSLTGGSSEGVDSGLLKQKREIKELNLRRDEASGKLALAVASLEKLEAQLARVTKDLEASQKQSFEQEVQIMDRKKDLERAEAEFKNVEEAIRRQERDVEGLKIQLNTIVTQLQSAQESAKELRHSCEQAEVTSKNLEQELAATRIGLEKLSHDATEAQIKAARKAQEFSGLTEQTKRLEQNLTETVGQLSRMAEDSSKNSEVLEKHIQQLEETRSEFNKLLDQVKEAEKVLQEAREKYEGSAGQVRIIEEKAGGVQRGNNQLAQEIGEGQLKASQTELNQKYLIDQILERYMLNLSEVAEQYANREENFELAQEELTDLRDKLKKIGEVNLTAIQEYEELSTRYDFLTKQQQDLISAMESLRKVIDRINRICNRRFRETYEAVNERFKKVFPVLFGGGEAELTLVENAENPGEPGIEIMARPPGKKLQSVTLLSGGEKALTAVSLIFAIFLFKPSPFCLLDEVDAPLDDANVYRFNDLVKEMAKRSQVILVTHNKHTMEINNTLYGVTMEDPGVSKMVAVQLNA
jgi:chromosome segregation protein